jgi:hypothetical protein
VRWSEGSKYPQALVDGNVHTGWSAQPQDAWIVIDLHAHYEVSEFDLVAVNLLDSVSTVGPNQSPRVTVSAKIYIM